MAAAVRGAGMAVMAALVTQLAAPGVLAATPARGPAPASTPAPAPPVIGDSAQEITLQAMGLPSQTLFGRSSDLGVLFPPPQAPLGPSGSLVRLELEHSPLLDPATSSATILVNGQALRSLALDAASSDHATVDVKIPTPLLHADRANLVEIRVEMQLASRPGALDDDPSAFTRIAGQTLFRYQLYGLPGTVPPPRLDAYPFPLVGTHGTAPARLGLVMPDPPTDADMMAAFRLIADVGRRSVGQEVAPEAVTAKQLEWLKAGGLPALVVGGQARLAAADPLLKAAGFSATATGWVGPGGEQVGPDDGIVAAVTSPWDRHSPIVLVTGRSDSAVARATAALSYPASIPPGSAYFVVHPGYPAPQADLSAQPGGVLTFPELRGQEIRVEGAGHRTVSLTFVAPAVGAATTGDLALVLNHSPVPAGERSVAAVLFNGVAAGSLMLDRSNEKGSRVHVRVPGSVLHPGRNTLTFDFSLAGAAASAWLSPDVSLRLPGDPAGSPGLELLPFPVFNDPAGVRLVLAGASDAVLTASARFVSALGSRATLPPPLTTVYASEARGALLDSSSLLVLGPSALPSEEQRLARALHLPAAAPSYAGGQAQPFGVVQELAEAGRGPHSVVWVDGTGAAAVSLAGEALYRGELTGTAVGVDASGRVTPLIQDLSQGDPPVVTAVKVLIAVTAGLLVLVVGWHAWPARTEES